jgi:hypothetical protein
MVLFHGAPCVLRDRKTSPKLDAARESQTTTGLTFLTFSNRSPLIVGEDTTVDDCFRMGALTRYFDMPASPAIADHANKTDT